MNYVSNYIKERLTEVIIKSVDSKEIIYKILKEIPIIKRHDISYYDNRIAIRFWYYLDNELTQDRLELDLKKEIRDFKLNSLLNKKYLY